MKHLGTRHLETDRLILRRIEVSDASAMFNNWANDEEVTKYLTWFPHKSKEDTESFIKSWIDKYNSPTFYQFGIVLKENNELIGTITGSDVSDESIEIGYCIAKKYWNKGITSEATDRLVDYFLDEVKIPKVIGKHISENVNSGKVLLKCGFNYKYDEPMKDKYGHDIICKVYEKVR